jgi:hypothetical protein
VPGAAPKTRSRKATEPVDPASAEEQRRRRSDARRAKTSAA